MYSDCDSGVRRGGGGGGEWGQKGVFGGEKVGNHSSSRVGEKL